MTYKTIYTEVEVDLDEWRDDELVKEMNSRGYTCFKDHVDSFENSDWQMLLELIDGQPRNWEIDRVREKVFEARYKIE